MEKIQEFLNQNRTQDGPLSVQGQSEEELVCAYCGELFFILPPSEEGELQRRARRYRAVREGCPKCHAERQKAEAQEEIKRLDNTRQTLLAHWLDESGIPARYQRARLSTFQRDLQPTAYDTALRYLDLLTKTEDCPDEILPVAFSAKYSLMLSSQGNGTGKTHLAAAIANMYMIGAAGSWYSGNSQRCPVFFTTVPRMLLRLRATYREDAEESETDVINDLSTVDLLVLDDVGKEKPSEHTRQTYFTVIDARYGADLPMIITSNLVLPKQAAELKSVMGDACLSRLKEMTDGWRVVMDGPDYRFRETAAGRTA